MTSCSFDDMSIKHGLSNNPDRPYRDSAFSNFSRTVAEIGRDLEWEWNLG